MDAAPTSFEGMIACRLAEFYAGLGPSDVPVEVMQKTRRVLVDLLAALAVGYQEGAVAKIANDYFAGVGGAPEATVLGLDRKLPAINSAFLMGVMAHSIELDDGHRWGTSHPGVSVVPAVLAMAERNENSFGELLTGIVVGYDAMLRVARAINPQHLRRGFHSTGTCGSIGAAAGCAALLKLDKTQVAYAMSLGGLQSAGLCEMLHDQPGIKPIQPGKAAMAGVLSADLASRGVTSPRSIFEGQHGWLNAMCDGEYSLPALLDDLGDRWEIMYNYIKMYPTCRHCHAAIDLAREAREALGCGLEDIESIEVRTYELGYVEVGQISCPESFEAAMFSLPFAVAIALDTGNVTLQDYTPDKLRDERLRSVAAGIAIEIDERMNAIYPEERGCQMKVTHHDGRVFHKSVPLAKGEPETPVSDEELMAKHEAMLRPYYDGTFVEGLWGITVCKELDEVRYEEIVEHFRRYVGQ